MNNRKLVLICGDRDWEDRQTIRSQILKLSRDTIIVQGGARGADEIAKNIAYELGFIICTVPALWHVHGKMAGPIRNRKMLDLGPRRVLAFHNNLSRSKGTKDCVTEAKRRGIKVKVFKEGER